MPFLPRALMIGAGPPPHVHVLKPYPVTVRIVGPVLGSPLRRHIEKPIAPRNSSSPRPYRVYPIFESFLKKTL
jgi:hypothetical protein